MNRWELLIVDDGSDQPVRTLVEQSASGAPIRYYYQENAGLGAARARGAELARGDYLCYLDDDDYFLPDHLRVLHTAMLAADHRVALYKTGIIREEADGRRTKSKLYDGGYSALQQHWVHGDSMFPYAVPRRVALREPSRQFYFAEDFNWLGRLMLRLPVIPVDAYTVVYRWHGGNRTNALLNRDVLEGRVAAVQALYAFPGMAERIPISLYRRNLSHQCLHWVRQNLRAGQFREAAWGGRRAAAYFAVPAVREWMYTGLVLLRAPGAIDAMNRGIGSRLAARWLQLRWPLIHRLLRRRGFGISDVLIVAGQQRSGTTWLMERLAGLLPAIPNFEPLNEPSSERRTNGDDPNPNEPGELDSPTRAAYPREAFTLARPTIWTTQYAKLWDALTARYVLTKIVRGGPLFPGLIESFDFSRPPIILLRHPVSTAISHRMAFNLTVDLRASLDKPRNVENERFQMHREFLRSLLFDVSRRVALWCIDQEWILKEGLRDERVRVVFYEQLLLHPTATIRSIIQHWNIRPVRLDKLTDGWLRRPSRTVKSGYFTDKPQEQLRKAWRSISEDERVEIQRVLDYFNVSVYHSSDPLPRLYRPT